MTTTALTLHRTTCTGCGVDVVSTAQVERWPHLSRYRIGDLDDEGRCGPCSSEPSRAEPSRAEPSRAEPSRAEPSRAEPSRAEPSRAEPSPDGGAVQPLDQPHRPCPDPRPPAAPGGRMNHAAGRPAGLLAMNVPIITYEPFDQLQPDTVRQAALVLCARAADVAEARTVLAAIGMLTPEQAS